MIFRALPFQVDQAFQEILIVAWIYAGFLTRVLATMPQRGGKPGERIGLLAQVSLFIIFGLIIAIVAEVILGRSLHRAPEGAGDMSVHFLMFGAQGVFFIVMGCLVFPLFSVASPHTRRVAIKSLAWTLVGVFLMLALGARLK